MNKWLYLGLEICVSCNDLFAENSLLKIHVFRSYLEFMRNYLDIHMERSLGIKERHFTLISLPDRNECVDTPEVCRSNQECRNTPGSYVCRDRIQCGAGFELNEAGTRCEGQGQMSVSSAVEEFVSVPLVFDLVRYWWMFSWNSWVHWETDDLPQSTWNLPVSMSRRVSDEPPPPVMWR